MQRPGVRERLECPGRERSPIGRKPVGGSQLRSTPCEVTEISNMFEAFIATPPIWHDAVGGDLCSRSQCLSVASRKSKPANSLSAAQGSPLWVVG
jgi:hypothetical protein